MLKKYRRLVQLERLESRCVLSATIVENQDIGYFFNGESSRVDRYDIVQESWLSSIPLTAGSGLGSPTAAHVDNDGIYVAYGRAVYRFDLTGSERVHLINTQYNVSALHSDGNLLFINHSSGLYSRFISIDKSSNMIIDTFDNYLDTVYGSSISTELNVIVGRSQGISPSDITFVGYSDSGAFTRSGDSPYHGDYPSATRTWVFPNGQRVVDSSGTVYAAEGLAYVGSLGSSVTDIDFRGVDVPIVLSGKTISAYSSARVLTGSHILNEAPSKIFVNDNDVIAFISKPDSELGYETQIIPLSDLRADEPGEPIDPVGLAFVPDAIEIMHDGTLLLFSRSHQSLFRWNPVSQSYVESIPLIGTPTHFAYSKTNNTAYLAYKSGLIRKIDLSAQESVETPFVTLPGQPSGLAAIGEYLFAVDPSGAWVTHYTFSKDGTQLSAVDWNYYSKEFVWNEVNSKLYFFRDDTSPNDLLSEEITADGKLGQRIDSPLHSSEGFQHPIRVSPDGKIVLLGSGMIHDGQTLVRQPYTLANGIADAAWLGTELFTARSISGVTQLQQWYGPTYELGKVVERPGTPLTLKAMTPDRLVSVIMNPQGVPTFTIWNRNLDPATVMPSWHNPLIPADVNGDSQVVPQDMLIVVNFLNAAGSGETSSEIASGYVDTNGDGFVSPLDALLIINFINRADEVDFQTEGPSLDSIARFFAAWDKQADELIDNDLTSIFQEADL